MGILHNIHNYHDNAYYYCSRNDCPCSDIYLFDNFHDSAVGASCNHDIDNNYDNDDCARNQHK